MEKLKPVKGAKIRLRYDITTRGGTKFRAGVVMRIGGTGGGYRLEVRVRSRWHFLSLKKKDYPHYFEVISVPNMEECSC